MDYEGLPNNDLIKRCAEQPADRRAWNEFYRRFDDHIRAMVIRYGGLKRLYRQDLVDDLMQDAYVRLVKHDCKALKNFRGENENAIYTFLAFTARTAVDEYAKKRNAKKRRHQDEPLDKPVSPEEGGLRLIDILANPYAPSTDEKLMLESLQQEVEMILGEIISGHEKERDQKIFLCHVYEELTLQQISERFALSPKRLRHIITEIKKRLKARPPGGKKTLIAKGFFPDFCVLYNR